ncbi:MAG: SDR family oxidoreductase [Halioglobus sp.]
MPRKLLITGCSSGIGRALADAFRQQGDTVIATARRIETLDALKAQGCETETLDVNSDASMQALLDSISQRHAHIDVLINNAGISAMGPLAEIPADKLRGQFETNVIAPVLLTQKLLPLIRKSSQGVIINIGSISGVLTTPFAGAYCASKAAIHSISDAMRMELAPFGIRVVTVQPGGIKSNFGDAAAASVNDWLSDDSLYAPIRDGIMARAGASQENATPAEEFAAVLVKSLNSSSDNTWNIGHGSRAFPLMARWLPEKLLSKALSKKFALTRL